MITEKERNSLIKEMENLLDEFGYEHSDDALNTIIDEWLENKGNLIEMFKKHPNYIEGKFMIAFDTNYKRGIDKHGIYNFSMWLRNNVCFIELPKEINDRRIADGCTWLPKKLYNFIEYAMPSYTERTISDELADLLKEIIPEIHPHAGQKTTRVINKMCQYLGFGKLADYNKEFAKYADSLNPLTIKRHTIISLNPLDYLTMSFGNSWSSCHTIDKANKRNMPNGYQGQYSSGTMSYLLDGSSMVMYTVDGKYEGNEYYTQPKITRQMFHYGEYKLVQGRLYPGTNDYDEEVYTQYRNIMQQIMSELLDMPNLWTVGKGNSRADYYVASRGTHYRDYANFSSCTLSQLKGKENENYFEVGHDPICISCGYEHENEETIDCCNAPRGMYTCADCGRFLDEDDVCYAHGESYCRECVNYCEHCDEYHRTPEYYVDYVDGHGYGGYVCEHCYEHYYASCEHCNESEVVDDMIYTADGNWVCKTCFERYYAVCEECGEIYLRTEMHERDGFWCCEDCYEEEESTAEAV